MKSKRQNPALAPHFAERWVFVRWLTEGGQATTCIVCEKMTGEKGVLKQPKKLDEVSEGRFRREIAIVLECEHPAIVRLLDYSLDSKQLGYVSPFGKTLKEFWDAKRISTTPTELYDLAYAFMASIAEGLAELHNKNVVHRDLKAGNVIVMSEALPPQPVVIDFGLAFRESDERLSIVDNRVVHNLDTSPAEAYYRHIEPRPAWDCIGLGWLYGYLVGAGRPENNRFHWKYHPLVEEPRMGRVRALLAQCSDIEFAPVSAHGFRTYMDNLGLGLSSIGPTSSAVDFGEATWALKDSIAARARRQVEQNEQVQVCQAAFGPMLEQLRSKLDELIAQRHELPIAKINSSQTGHSFDEHFRVAFNGDEANNVPFFWVRCGATDALNFNICAYLEYDPRNRNQNEILFNLRIDCRHSKGKWNECERFYFEKDGSLVRDRSESKRNVRLDEIVLLVADWLKSADYWSAVG